MRDLNGARSPNRWCGWGLVFETPEPGPMLKNDFTTENIENTEIAERKIMGEG